MVIHDFSFMRVAITPHKAQPVLVINSNAVLALAVPGQCLQAISRGNAQIVQVTRRVQPG